MRIGIDANVADARRTLAAEPQRSEHAIPEGEEQPEIHVAPHWPN